MERESSLPFRLRPDGSMEFATLDAMLEARQKLTTAPEAPALPQQPLGPARAATTKPRTPRQVKPPAQRAVPAAHRSLFNSEGETTQAVKPRRKRLPNEAEILAPRHSEVLDWVAAQTAPVDSHVIGQQFAWMERDPNRAMSGIRERLEAAGFPNGTALSWRIAGFGSSKRCYYEAGPVLRGVAVDARA